MRRYSLVSCLIFSFSAAFLAPSPAPWLDMVP